MRLKSLISMVAAVGLIANCSPQLEAAGATTGTSPQELEGRGQGAENENIQRPTSKEPTPAPSREGEPAKRENDTLLFRAQFAGTTALMANTNAAYLTNFASLPETVALGTQVAAKVAALPGRFFGQRGAGSRERGTDGGSLDQKSEGGGQEVSHQASVISNQLSVISDRRADGTPTGEELLRPMFGEMLRDGFTLELRGSSNGVTEFALAAKAHEETVKGWDTAWRAAATNWLTAATPADKAPHPVPLPFRRGEGEGWSAGEGRIMARRSGDWFLIGMSKTNASVALAAIQKTVASQGLDLDTVLQGELASSLLPGPVQRSVYGGFSRLKLSATPADQSLRIRGTATYAHDLPQLGPPPVMPTNLITEPAISFTMVREPSAWLEASSALLQFLPNPAPNTAYFWGGESSPFQLFMAVPFPSSNDFQTSFGNTLISNLMPLAELTESGPLKFDDEQILRWGGMSFVGPNVTKKESGTNAFLVCEIFPALDSGPGLPPAIVQRISNQPNLVLYDWELTQFRIDTWLCVGQLALLLSKHEQLAGGTPSLKWIKAAPVKLINGGNCFTEITQTGPRELTFARRAPLAFNSTELFWLANWLESPNFPAANFLVPVAQ